MLAKDLAVTGYEQSDTPVNVLRRGGLPIDVESRLLVRIEASELVYFPVGRGKVLLRGIDRI